MTSIDVDLTSIILKNLIPAYLSGAQNICICKHLRLLFKHFLECIFLLNLTLSLETRSKPTEQRQLIC